MGLFRDQASRLLRERWPDANLLAEELYAMFTSDVPVSIDSPVIITSTNGAPPLTLRNFGTGDGAIQIIKQGPPQVVLPEIPPLDFSGVGEENVTNVYDDGETETFGGEEGARGTGTNPNSGGGGGGFPGKVLSGSGSSYQVAVYESGLSSEPTTRTVTQLSIAEGEVVPADTWALVGQSGEAYFMQVPVWL